MESTMESILDILKKEDELVKKHNNLSTEYTDLLRKIDDYGKYPDYYYVTNAEILAMKEKVLDIDEKITILNTQIGAAREKIRRNLIRLFDY